MNIVTALPRYSDGEVNRAFIAEIKTGFQLEKAMEQKREIQAAHEAKLARENKPNALLGPNVAIFPERDFFRLVHKYGHAEVHSKGFIKYFQKKFSHLCPHKM